MLNRLITWSLEHRLLIIALALVGAGAGGYAVTHIPIDAFPDTTPVQVQVNTVAPALAPGEIEQQVTFPVEQVLSGIPDLKEVRSLSKTGFSQVTAVFVDGTDIWLARQQVMERLQAVELPAGIDRPELGPVATGLGEVYHYILRSDRHSLTELTAIHDWEVKPRLASVPGVAEVNTWGGKRREYHVLVDLDDLIEHEMTLDDVAEALVRNNLTVGGGYVQQGGELHVVQGRSLPTSEEAIRGIVIATFDGVSVRIRDVARVTEAHELRRGAATAQGGGEVVLGLAFMLMGENSHEVTQRLEERMAVIARSLPEGVRVEPVYVRTELVDQVIETVKENLFEGAILVVAVLFAFLGSLRAGLIVAAAIPLSMLFAAGGMLRLGIAGSLMSLGAIDFGLVVDSSVIMVENSVRRLAEKGERRSVLEIVRDASLEVRRPTLFGEAIIMVVYLPILTLEGIEGKLFRPMALTVIFALAGSMVLSVTLMPVLASLLLSRRTEHKEGRLIRGLKALYRPVLRLAMAARGPVIAGALVVLAGTGWLATRTGAEFIPRLMEMGVVVNTIRLSGVSLDESIRYGTQIEQTLLKQFPDEIRHIWTRTGTAEVATDPMGIELSDVFITLKPRGEWTKASTQLELMAAIRQELEQLPGMRMVLAQPIELRVNEMVAGIRADVGVKLFGPDLEELRAQAAAVEAILADIPGSADLYTEQITGQPQLEIEIDPQALSRHGIAADKVLQVVEAIGGIQVGEIRQDPRRFALVVRLAERHRADPTAIGRIRLPTPKGERIPLARVAHIRQTEGPATITREWQQRRIVVQSNVVDRDVASFVEEANRRLTEELELPTGYYFELGGQFEHLERARTRLYLVVPLALLLILLLLYLSTQSALDAVLIFTGAPFAAVGGLVALHLRDLPFTISAGVGFVAVFGVAMLAGLVLLSTIRQLEGEGMPLFQAIEEGALRRLRPVLMTALVASLGFVPMALNTGVGAEVQRPLATVVIGGVISANALTLVVLPALVALIGGARRQEADLSASGDTSVPGR